MVGQTRVVSGRGGVGMLVRAALPSVPGLGSLPGVRKSGEVFAGLAVTRPPVVVERSEVEAYAGVCGFPVKDSAPLTYPHLLAFPLHMALMTDPAFPAPAIGMVHLENSITQHRPIAIAQTLDVAASVSPPSPHPRGQAFDFVTTIRCGGEVAWESASTYLRRGVGGDPAASRGTDLPEVPAGTTVWRLPSDLGRRYASVSGDYNPIHLFGLTAKALGFRRQIAHGMWTLGRSVAALENRLPDAVRVEVAFRKPVFLPAKVAFGAEPVDGGYGFTMTKPGSGTVHLVGRTTSLPVGA